jgi:hypothetical protein
LDLITKPENASANAQLEEAQVNDEQEELYQSKKMRI